MKKAAFALLFLFSATFSLASCGCGAKSYDITWLNDDGTTLSVTKVKEGELPKYDKEIPIKQPTVDKVFVFAGWTPQIVKATCDTSYVATYIASTRRYTISWYNDKDATTPLHTEELEYGATPSYHWEDKPTKKETDRIRYDWNGEWEETIIPVIGSANYHAKYDEVNKYLVTFKNYDDTVLQESYVASDSLPVYDGEEPSCPPDDVLYTYERLGWDKDLVKPKSDTVYIATYKPIPVTTKYNITWMDGINGDRVLKEETLAYGATPTPPTDVTKKITEGMYEYTFLNTWSPVITRVTGDATYVAQYSQKLRDFDITWKNYDGNVLYTSSVTYGTTPSYAGDIPTKVIEGHSFEWIGWDKEIAPATHDETYIAAFDNDIIFDFEGIRCTINGKTEFTDVYTFDESEEPALINYVIKPIGSYTLPDNISVYVDNNLVTSEYSYDKTTGAFSIASNLGNIRLEVAGVQV